jgi:ribosome-binding protein aMBF1 (putative translation factor)
MARRTASSRRIAREPDGRDRRVSPTSPLDRLRERARARRATDDADRYYAALADQVIEHRLARALSQRELAELCGTTQSAIARLERGGRPPRIDTLLRIANALDCELVITLTPRTKLQRRTG